MKTQEQIEEAINEIAEVCKKHGVVLYGYCSSEGIYGEIIIAESIPSWRNFGVEPWRNYDDEYQVEAIGLTKEG